MEIVFIIIAVVFGAAWLYNAADKAEMRVHRLKQRQKRRGW